MPSLTLKLYSYPLPSLTHISIGYQFKRYAADSNASPKCQYLKTNYRTIDVPMCSFEPNKYRWIVEKRSDRRFAGFVGSERFAEAFIVRGDLVPSDIGRVDFESSFVAHNISAPALWPKSLYSVSIATILWFISLWLMLIFDSKEDISNNFIIKIHRPIKKEIQGNVRLTKHCTTTGNGSHFIRCVVVSSVLNLFNARNAVGVVPTAFYRLSRDHHQFSPSSRCGVRLGTCWLNVVKLIIRLNGLLIAYSAPFWVTRAVVDVIFVRFIRSVRWSCDSWY